MSVAHAQDGFIQIDVRIVDSSELELVHQVVVHLFAVQAASELHVVKRSDAVGQTFLQEVVGQVQMVFRTYGDGHVDGTFPVGIGQHFQHHQLTLVEHVLAFQ